MLIHDLTLQPTDRAPVASNRLILAQRRSLQSPKADAGGINQHRKRGQYLGVDFLHFGNRSDFSPKKKTITSTTSATDVAQFRFISAICVSLSDF
jgi:hypothetical protein